MSSMMENVYNGISWFSNRGGGGDSMQPSTGCIKMNYGNESARIPFVGNGSNLVTPPPPPFSRRIDCLVRLLEWEWLDILVKKKKKKGHEIVRTYRRFSFFLYLFPSFFFDPPWYWDRSARYGIVR